MRLTRFRIVRDLRATAGAWLDDNCASRAAALSFFAAFSIAPMLVIAVAMASFVFQREEVLASVLAESRRLFGDEGAGLIARLLVAARHQEHRGLAAGVAVFALLLGATSGFSELKDSLDAIWRVPKSRISGVRALLRARLLSFCLVLAVGLLLLASLLLNAVLTSFTSAFAVWLGLGATLLAEFGSGALSLGCMVILFGLVFRLLPAIRPTWRVAWRGSLVTTALFLLGKAGMGLYLEAAATTSSFGAAGSLAALLLWIYYSALVVFAGAEYARVLTQPEAAAARPAAAGPGASEELPR